MKKRIVFLLLLGTCWLGACEGQQKPAQEPASAADFFITPEGDTIERVVKSEAEWRRELSPLEYQVLREAGTERPFTGELLYNKERGLYVCRGCGFPLFHSQTKFKSGTGWPSFFRPLNDYCIEERIDTSYGMRRVEVLCARCGGHLGHVFEDGPPPTGLRYCINSAALVFRPEEP